MAFVGARSTEPKTHGKVHFKTNVGTLEIALYVDTPLASRNFIQLCLNGFYNDLLFFRVDQGKRAFVGDPENTGLGPGVAAFGSPFRDEIRQDLRYSRRGLLAMYNGDHPRDKTLGNRDNILTAPKTAQDHNPTSYIKHNNTSKFFITMDAIPQINDMYPIFGTLTGSGFDTISRMNELPIKDGKFMQPVRVITATVIQNPYPDIVATIPPEAIKTDQGDAGSSPSPSAEQPSELPVIQKPRKQKNIVLSFQDDDDFDDVDVFSKKSKKSRKNKTSTPAVSSLADPTNISLSSDPSHETKTTVTTAPSKSISTHIQQTSPQPQQKQEPPQQEQQQQQSSSSSQQQPPPPSSPQQPPPQSSPQPTASPAIPTITTPSVDSNFPPTSRDKTSTLPQPARRTQPSSQRPAFTRRGATTVQNSKYQSVLSGLVAPTSGGSQPPPAHKKSFLAQIQQSIWAQATDAAAAVPDDTSIKPNDHQALQEQDLSTAPQEQEQHDQDEDDGDAQLDKLLAEAGKQMTSSSFTWMPERDAGDINNINDNNQSPNLSADDVPSSRLQSSTSDNDLDVLGQINQLIQARKDDKRRGGESSLGSLGRRGGGDDSYRRAGAAGDDESYEDRRHRSEKYREGDDNNTSHRSSRRDEHHRDVRPDRDSRHSSSRHSSSRHSSSRRETSHHHYRESSPVKRGHPSSHDQIDRHHDDHESDDRRHRDKRSRQQ